MAKKQQGVDVRLIGTKLQIDSLLAAFTAKGFIWQSNEHFYPRIGQPNFFSYYLENLEFVRLGRNEYKGLSTE